MGGGFIKECFSIVKVKKHFKSEILKQDLPSDMKQGQKEDFQIVHTLFMFVGSDSMNLP